MGVHVTICAHKNRKQTTNLPLTGGNKIHISGAHLGSQEAHLVA